MVKPTAEQQTIETLFPAIAQGVRGYGHIEIGDREMFGFVARALYYGNLAFEDDKPDTLAEAMADSLTGLRPDGRLVVMGIENKALPIHPGDLIARRIRILGSQQNGREYLHEALQIAAAGKVKVMAETYSLDEITQAYERVAEGKVRFRAVITPGT